MIEPEPVKKLSKKDQLKLDEEVAQRLQAKFNEKERIKREKANKEAKVNIALKETWDDIQAKIDADCLLVERLQEREQEELTIEDRAILFQQILEKRRKHFAAKRAEEKRNKPPTRAQQRSIILMEVISNEEEVAVDAIPLATKPPSIVDWKIHKEGKKSYYQIIRADGSSKMYLVFSHMLKSFDREDLETLYKLVKANFLSSSQNSSRINEVFGSFLLVINEAFNEKLEILKKNIKFRGGLLGLKDFLMILELLLLRFMLLLLSKT
ncbi:hypothetical protein Tco_0364266 [Tanacetum coccineum]